MNALSNYLTQHWLAGLTWLGSTVSAFAIGYFADIRKEDHRQKMRRREEHADEIKKDVLKPIYDHLRGFYLPICQMKMSPLEMSTKQIDRKEVGSVAENPYVQTEHAIAIKPPGILNWKGTLTRTLFTSWPETEEFQRYFNDALRHHYPNILKKWTAYLGNYNSAVEEAKIKAESIIPMLEKLIGLPAALASFSVSEPSYRANYQYLALLVFHRQSGIGQGSRSHCIDAITVGGSDDASTLESFNQRIVWCNGPQEGNRIIDIIDEMIKNAVPNYIAVQKAQFEKLKNAAESLIKEMDFSLAQKPRLKKCPLAG